MAKSSRSTRSAAAFRTVNSLNEFSIGSLNQTITRSGATSNSLFADGLDLIWFACASALAVTKANNASKVAPANTPIRIRY